MCKLDHRFTEMFRRWPYQSYLINLHVCMSKKKKSADELTEVERDDD